MINRLTMDDLCVTGPFVTDRFHMNESTKSYLKTLTPSFGFGSFGETVFYRTYSRKKADGSNENWAEVVIRVVEGVLSIRKDFYIKHYLSWKDSEWQQFARDFAEYIFKMRVLPPGRGLWACGTEFMYERGSAALNNCGAATTKDLILGVVWIMDMLMCGCGTGFDTLWNGNAHQPNKDNKYVYVIPDTREGWVTSVGLLLAAYIPQNDTIWRYESDTPIDDSFPVFDYSKIRKKGEPIRGFGGEASGPDPLIKLHKRIKAFMNCYLNCQENPEKTNDNIYSMAKWLNDNGDIFKDWNGNPNIEQVLEQILDQGDKKTYDKTRCIADIMNAVGACVVAGNVRRSSEIALGEVGDDEFLNLKNFELNPERSSIGWMSNNSIRFNKSEQFAKELPSIAERIRVNGEPGFFNQLNVRRFGRVGRRYNPNEPWTREREEDFASIPNPCAEIPLEPGELCNLSELFPTRCLNDVGEFDMDIYLQACKFATFYCSTVSLLPTHWKLTNKIIAKNRRTGVSMTGVADHYCKYGFAHLTEICRAGYKMIRSENSRLAQEAGVNASIRVTTNKPSGSVSSVVGVSPGVHFPTFKYAIRRMRVSDNHPICKSLIDNDIPHEKDVKSDNTIIFEFPIDQGSTRAAKDVTIWEQMSILTALQREWSDNMVSVTIYFDPKTEGDQIETALAINAPNIKSCSMLPHTGDGAYPQMPYEEISKEEYERRIKDLKPVDWSTYNGSDGKMPKYCTNDTCYY